MIGTCQWQCQQTRVRRWRNQTWCESIWCVVSRLLGSTASIAWTSSWASKIRNRLAPRFWRSIDNQHKFWPLQEGTQTASFPILCYTGLFLSCKYFQVNFIIRVNWEREPSQDIFRRIFWPRGKRSLGKSSHYHQQQTRQILPYQYHQTIITTSWWYHHNMYNHNIFISTWPASIVKRRTPRLQTSQAASYPCFFNTSGAT